VNGKMLQRTRIFFVLVLILFILPSVRLAELQVVQHDYYRNLAESNRLRLLPVTAPRGKIYDQNEVQLVTNRPGFTVSLMDQGQGFSPETISYLGDLLDMSEDEISGKIRDNFYRRYTPIRLQQDVDREVVARISEIQEELPGVIIETQPIREYSFGDLAPHILGYLGRGSPGPVVKEMWEQQSYSYRTGQLVGQTGLEQVWEPYLRGVDGYVQVEVNALGQATREYGRMDPIPGSDLHLTLDSRLQGILEEALGDTVEEKQENGNDYAGQAAGVVLEPDSGRILAMASYPGYDLNTFEQDFPDLARAEDRPLINKAIEEAYPVGSTFKMVPALAALEEDAVRPEQIIYCGGTYSRHGATKTCFREIAHGSVNVSRALIRSCNVFFYETALKLGIDDLTGYAEEFGFGSRTGLVDIRGETGGIVACRDYKEERFGDPWYPAETMDAAIGQGYHSITPLQLANYAAMLANEGTHYRPYLVEKAVDSKGQIDYEAEPEVLHTMDVEDQTWEIIGQSLQGVAQPGGTAARLADLGVSVAVKTGTAEAGQAGGGLPPHGVIVGYAPAEQPELAFAILIAHGGMSGTSALPAAYSVLDQYYDS